MSSNSIINVGIIGLGVGEKHIDGYLMDPRCNILSVADFNPKILENIKNKFPLISLCNNANLIINDPSIKIISIASYDNYHYEHVIKAINKSKHIFVEKPLCLNSSELSQIKKSLQENSHVKICSNLILRKLKKYIELRDRIANGFLGEIFYVEGDYDYGRLEKLTHGWRGSIPYYSVMLGGGIHMIDLILWILGDTPHTVTSFGNKIASNSTNFRFNDFTAALMQFNSGVIAKVTANFGSVLPHGHKLCVYGTKGTFIQTHQNSLYYTSRNPQDIPLNVDDNYKSLSKGQIIPDFIRHIYDGGDNPVPLDELFATMEVALAVDKSVEIGAPVKILLN